MPQTIEHVEILHLLDISCGVVAVTKIDMVEPDMVELVVEEVRDLLADTPLATAPICPVSSTSGMGLEELKDAIVTASGAVQSDIRRSPFRMAVDRVFVVQGRGTVVTGSVLSGSVAEGDTLDVWPAGKSCRVRGLQSHGSDSRLIGKGQRAALNLSGVDRDYLHRGAELATHGFLEQTRMLDVHLHYLGSCTRAFKSSTTVRLEIGAVEIPARVVLVEGGSVEPGESTFAQLRCGESLTATFGQRFIVRDQNAARTIGGGFVLRPTARRGKRRSADEVERLRRLFDGSDEDRIEEVLRSARFSQPTDLQLCARTGACVDDLPAMLENLCDAKRWVEIPGTGVRAVPSAIDDLAVRLESWMQRHHQRHADLPGRPADAVLGYLERLTVRSLARPLFDTFVKRKLLKRLGRFVCLPAFAPSLSGSDEKLLASMIDRIHKGGFQPPSLDGLGVSEKADRKRIKRLATLAVALGELVQIDAAMYLYAEVEAQLRETVSDLVKRNGGVSVAEVREALGSSRKFVVPFLEYLDRIGFTKRIGDQRVLAEVVSE